jgi:hypothetical protein
VTQDDGTAADIAKADENLETGDNSAETKDDVNKAETKSEGDKADEEAPSWSKSCDKTSVTNLDARASRKVGANRVTVKNGSCKITGKTEIGRQRQNKAIAQCPANS